MKEELEILNVISQTIFDKKGVNILALDVRPCTDMTDYVIIAEGLADTHVKAIALEILRRMDKEKVTLAFEEGLKNGDWIVLDFSSIVVHLFMPGMREKYALENLWQQALIVDVAIDASCMQKAEGIE